MPVTRARSKIFRFFLIQIYSIALKIKTGKTTILNAPMYFHSPDRKSNPCLFSAPIIYKSEIHRLEHKPLRILLFHINISLFHVITPYPYNFLPTTCSRHKLAFAFPACNIMFFFTLYRHMQFLAFHKVKQKRFMNTQPHPIDNGFVMMW